MKVHRTKERFVRGAVQQTDYSSSFNQFYKIAWPSYEGCLLLGFFLGSPGRRDLRA